MIFIVSISITIFLFISITNSQRDSAYTEFSRLCNRKKTETTQQLLGGITILNALRQNSVYKGISSASEWNKTIEELIYTADWNITLLSQLSYFANVTLMNEYIVPRNITRRIINTNRPRDNVNGVGDALLMVNTYPTQTAIGTDYYTDNDRYNVVQTSIKTKKLSISEPFTSTTTPNSKLIIFFLPNFNTKDEFIGGFSGVYRQEVVIVDKNDTDLSYQVTLNDKMFFTDTNFKNSAFIVSFEFSVADDNMFIFSCGSDYSTSYIPILIFLLGIILSFTVPIVVFYSSRQIKRIEEATNEKLQIEKEISLAKLNEQTAIQSASLKSAFLANISHEIRTPLNGIVGMTEFLLETDLHAEQRNYVDIIKQSSGMLMSIVNDVLDFSKAESQKLTREDLVCNIVSIIHEIPNIYSNKTNDNNNKVSFQHEFTELWCKTDPSRLQQILVNLFSNATKFTSNGLIIIKAVKEPNRIVCSISDTGIGMTNEQLSKLFTPFTQADTSTTRKYGGTGLGLSICKKLTELLGGEIWVTSEIGKGSTFSFSIPYIPAVEPEQIEIKIDESEDDYKSFSRDKVILIVDDNKINLKVAEKMLKNLGYLTVCANDGVEAVSLMTAGGDYRLNYSAILMDIQMPNVDGYTATKVLRERGIVIPIIAMTANVLSGEREKCIASGMDEYLTKPLNQKVMETVIRDTIICVAENGKMKLN